MSDKKHIDRLFQENFKDFEATPSDAVWKNIEAELNPDKKKRRIIPIWWRYAGVAALLALLLTVGSSYFFNEGSTNPIQVVDTEDSQNRGANTPDSNTSEIAIENSIETKINLENDSQKETTVAANKTHVSQKSKLANTTTSNNKNQNTLQTGFASNKKLNIRSRLTTPNNTAVASVSEDKNKSTESSVAHNSEIKETAAQNEGLIPSDKAKELINNTSKDNTTIALTEDKEKTSLTIEEALDAKKDIIETESNTNKWRITPNAAPVYFNSLGEGSSIDPQFNTNSKTGEVNMSYGVSASYVINNKLKLRSGVNKVNLGYNTNNVVLYQAVGISSSTRAIPNINASTTNASADNVSVISGETFAGRPESFATTNSSINQALGYIEVPLEIQYALVSRKLGVNVIGGFSSFFLSDNKIYSESETGQSTYLGEANNINNVSYSANFGVGFNYQVSKKIDLNLEPMFKYQINTFNNTSGNFTPFFIGVYTGFAIKF
ncbi:hypothetical protein [Mariniflexile sp. AS56]|uniref:hypothetical protein n=1 Tax=Mariniflexile sp. AS56 TaxID=3063957 RepID=UPI0026EF4863|nr:hypothetical protein [Mariniflexile sp. AS56]MDO7172200.1 hypothetical protein [Mariniflexile sp. AS56]